MKCCLPAALGLLGLFFAACGRQGAVRPATDAATRQVIAGTWGLTISNRVEGVMDLRPDGRFSGSWSNRATNEGWSFEGDWRILNGGLVTRIAKKSGWKFTLSGPTGTVERVRILRLTDKELVGASRDQTNKWERKK